MRRHRAPSRRRQTLHHRRHRRRIVADGVKDRIVQPRRRRLHPLPRRPRAISANNSARHNPYTLRRPHKLRRRRLLRLQRSRQKRLRANNGGSVRLNPHKLRRLRLQRRRRRRLRADKLSNGLSVRRKLRRLRLLPRRQFRRQRRRRQSRLSLRQRLRQNRPMPITAKSRTATGKTTGPLRPDPVHGIGCAIFEREIQALRLSLGSSRCAVCPAAPGSVKTGTRMPALLRASGLRNIDDKLRAWIASVDLDSSPKLLRKGADQPHSQSLAFVRLEIRSDANSFVADRN